MDNLLDTSGFNNWIAKHWRNVLSRVALPLLAIVASYGVYSYTKLFVPELFAVLAAAAFEMVYIGLAVVTLQPSQQKRGRQISYGAVGVSVIYNVLAGLIDRNPNLLKGMSTDTRLYAEIAMAVLHGVPLAVLAFLVADLLLHQFQPIADPEKEQLQLDLHQVQGSVAELQNQLIGLQAELQGYEVVKAELQLSAIQLQGEKEELQSKLQVADQAAKEAWSKLQEKNQPATSPDLVLQFDELVKAIQARRVTANEAKLQVRILLGLKEQEVIANEG
jgi:uncharacterized membrane protein YhiD involved in acid resistance